MLALQCLVTCTLTCKAGSRESWLLSDLPFVLKATSCNQETTLFLQAHVCFHCKLHSPLPCQLPATQPFYPFTRKCRMLMAACLHACANSLQLSAFKLRKLEPWRIACWLVLMAYCQTLTSRTKFCWM